MNYRIILLLFIILFAGCGQIEDLEDGGGLSVSKVMGDLEEADFTKAIEKRTFSFPADHGPHYDFRTEWWYFTGNLTSRDGKKFGYQFTIFRTGLTKEKRSRTSDWSSNQVYMAHFALTDISAERFYFDERFSRDGNELAGARINPMKVWQGNWYILQTSDDVYFDLPGLKLVAKSGGIEIDLFVRALKPYVLQGERGLSQKGGEAGNASYYYSYTRLETSGSVSVEGQEYKVSGLSWLDREWSTSALSGDQVGWDWFALQLDDGSEIMYYQMRKKDGTADVYSKGVISDREGNAILIRKEDVILEVLDSWQSPSGATYPSGWRLKIPERDIDLEIRPAIKNQLLEVTITYWEGSVSISGNAGKSSVNGRGYVELTGY